MFVQNHHSLEELQRLTKALTKKRIWLRHQAVVLAKQGHSAPAIARALGCSHRAVQAWVGRYNQGGLSALQERPHTGRPPRLAAADVPRFRDRLEAGPTPEDGVCTFRCQDLRRILEEEFGVSLRRQAIYDLLHRLDYTEVPGPKLGNPRSGQLLMSNSISGFWLHLDQPQRFRLQRIGVGYLEERRLSGIAGHHAAITTACTQVSHQCSKALHRQIACRSVRLLLRRTDSEAWAGATGSRRRRSSVNSSSSNRSGSHTCRRCHST